MEQFVYFGYDAFDAFTNMAIDHALYNRHLDGTVVRFYDFCKPALILAYNEHHSDVICNPASDITRRLSNGSVILCDENTVAYSITGPREIYNGPSSMHAIFGRKIGTALKEYLGLNTVTVGEHFSVRIDGKTIAGHGQRVGKSVLYHGVLAVRPWDMKKIAKFIRLRNKEYEFVQSLPAVSDYTDQTDKRIITEKLLAGITQGEWKQIDNKLRASLLEEAAKLSEFYRDNEWIQFGPYYDQPESRHRLERNVGLGFCFADFLMPEKGSIEV